MKSSYHIEIVSRMEFDEQHFLNEGNELERQEKLYS
jgi:hypothetical protein